MEDESLRGPHAEQSGWVTTKVAAQALRVDPRTIRKYISQGKLEARVEGEGVDKTYLVSIDSVYALRSVRSGPQTGRGDSPRGAAASGVSEDLVALVRDLTSEVTRRSSEAAELRTRLELTEQAESSLRNALEQRLERERILREQAERERDELREILESRSEATGAAESDEGALYGTSRQEAKVSLQRRSERSEAGSWWRRFFGLE
jgi:hypothetical protein